MNHNNTKPYYQNLYESVYKDVLYKYEMEFSEKFSELSGKISKLLELKTDYAKKILANLINAKVYNQTHIRSMLEVLDIKDTKQSSQEIANLIKENLELFNELRYWVEIRKQGIDDGKEIDIKRVWKDNKLGTLIKTKNREEIRKIATNIYDVPVSNKIHTVIGLYIKKDDINYQAVEEGIWATFNIPDKFVSVLDDYLPKHWVAYQHGDEIVVGSEEFAKDKNFAGHVIEGYLENLNLKPMIRN